MDNVLVAQTVDQRRGFFLRFKTGCAFIGVDLALNLNKRSRALIQRSIFVSVIFSMLPALQSQAASFDCRKAVTTIERLICSDQRLSELDEVLTMRYEESLAKSNLPGKKRLRNEQKQWLIDQRGKCSNIGCLTDIYEQRIKAIGGFPREILECPQCGAWQISGSSVQWMSGDILHIDESHVEISGCGVFDVLDDKILVSDEGDERKSYRVTLKLRPIKQFLLCNVNKSEWQMNIEVSGHFSEGGYAEFSLVSNKESGFELGFQAWNIYREDPCDAGSGRGHAECMALSNAIVTRSLVSLASIARADAYNKKPPRHRRFFDPEQFIRQIDSYCSEREKDSGGGLWPTAWALTCINNLLSEKYNEFDVWQKCAAKENKSDQCVMPGNNFVKRLRADE